MFCSLLCKQGWYYRTNMCKKRSEKSILTVAQASERMNVNRQHIRMLLAESKLAGYRTSERGDWRIPVSAITQYINKHSNQAEQSA